MRETWKANNKQSTKEKANDKQSTMEKDILPSLINMNRIQLLLESHQMLTKILYIKTHVKAASKIY